MSLRSYPTITCRVASNLQDHRYERLGQQYASQLTFMEGPPSPTLRCVWYDMNQSACPVIITTGTPDSLAGNSGARIFNRVEYGRSQLPGRLIRILQGLSRHEQSPF